MKRTTSRRAFVAGSCSIAVLLAACAAPPAPTATPAAAPAAAPATKPPAPPPAATTAPAAAPTATTAAPQPTSPAPAQPTATAAAAQPTPAAAKPSQPAATTVRVWTFYGLQDPQTQVVSNQVAQTLKSAKPAASVEVTSVPAGQFIEKITAARLAKQGPDLSPPSRFLGSFALNGWIQPMDDVFKEIKLTKDDLFAVVEQTTNFNGKWWLYPWYSGIKAYVYRTDFFQEAGIAKFPETWEQFFDATAKLTRRDGDKITRAGYQEGRLVDWEALLSWGRQNGALEFDEKLKGKSTVNAPEFLEAFTAYLDLKRKLKVAPLEGVQAPPGVFPITADLVAITRQGPWWVPNFRQQNPQNAEKLAVAPPLMRKQRSDWGFTDGWMLYKNDWGADNGIEFLKAFDKEENYIAYHNAKSADGKSIQYFPTPRKSINAKLPWIKDEPLMKEWMTWMDWGWPGATMHVAYGEIYNNAFMRAVERALYGILPDKAALDDAAKTADGITERAVKQNEA